MRRLLCALFTTLLALAGLAVLPDVAHAGIDAQKLGGRYDGTGANVTFRVFSAHATRIAVYVYAAATGQQEKASYVLTRDASGVWSATVSVATLRAAGVSATIYYGYRAWGPNWPYDGAWAKGSQIGFVSDVDAAGDRFNPNKLLLDPYAREISHDTAIKDPAATDYATGSARRGVDTGTIAPKGIVLATDATSTGTKPTRAFKDDIMYEVNLRGLTRNDPGVPAGVRGTYAGAALKAGYLSALGVTAVEFLPLQETQNDGNDTDPSSTSGDNYWGYQTLNFFAPDRHYSSDTSPGGPTREVKAMVKAFHDAGIKVFVDVVYNHTAEGGRAVPADKTVYPLFSWRGLDNPTYYSLTSDHQGEMDVTGLGHTFNTFNATAQNLIVDSVAYWKNDLGVDGLRFDLATVLGNTCQHGCYSYSRTNPATALNRLTAEMPARPAGGGTGVDWIAEPWAIGPGTYQVGNLPPGWSEWNGIFRDTLRADQNQLGVATVTPGDLATRFAGSSDLYAGDGRKPWNSIDIMVVHDGFTLKDLYSCNGKNNNQPWPYGPSDGGSDDNRSWDQGNIAADQRKAARNGLAFLMLSGGTPLITGGDEMLRSINCNNNSYNVDSAANWLNWSLTADEANFRTYAQRMIAFRKAHAALRPLTFYSAADGNGNGLGQLDWFTPGATAPDAAYWSNGDNHALAWRYDGTELGDTAAALYVGYNGWSGDVTFTLPAPPAGQSWYRVTDTSTWAEGAGQVADPGAETAVGAQGATYLLHGRAVLLLIAK
ncbi:alpha-amylase family glycosyl hydrolase [Krasilnikovia sp. MM14-A1259]|uniref:alpha-amylase family glycosyl hydrolase n=1 Tax=Krasilnikovia sp. MM14-A1259 TaxID=3373539 RepID=UPI00382E4973